MTALDGLKLKLDIYDEGFNDRLNRYLNKAAEHICLFTGRHDVPAELEVTLARIAATLYRHEQISDDVYKELLAWRTPRLGGIRRRG
ncbi:hypothetical protein FACS1894184_09340 [Clostridia bacterium]|nr:hypothetical protein FACS1894184_09340 [Clostridia bacterium]